MLLPDPLTPEEQELISKLQTAEPEGRCDYVDRQRQMPTIRAKLVRALCLGADSRIPAGPKGIVIDGCKIIGALDLENVLVEFPLRLRACDFDSKLTLTAATLRELDLMSSHLAAGINANELRIKGDLILDYSVVNGNILLSSATIERTMSCEGARFSNQGDTFLDATGISVGVDLNIRSARPPNTPRCFVGIGELNLHVAKIGGNLSCSGGLFRNSPPGRKGAFRAIYAEGISIEGFAHLRNRFRAIGEVSFFGAVIGGSLSFEGGIIRNQGYNALFLDNAKITGNVNLPWLSEGAVTARRAEFGNALRCNGVNLLNKGGTAVDMRRAQVKGTFEWADVAVQGQLDLRHAQAAQLDDEFGSWPDASVWLDGFQYGTLGQNASRWTVKQRCQWLASLAKDPEGYVSTQPYQQLLQVLRALGRDAEAREIAIAGQRSLRAGYAAIPSRIWNWFLYWTIAYGYKPWRALVPSLALLIIGCIVFSYADQRGLMVPAMSWAYQNQSPAMLNVNGETTAPAQVRKEYPRFVSPIYSLDTFLPIVDLRQKNYWIPKPSTTFGWFALSYLWFQIISGWILTTTLVAALSGLIKKE